MTHDESQQAPGYLVGSISNEGIRYQQAEQAAQAFLDLPIDDRPFVICQSWDGQKWTSRIIARTREERAPGRLKVRPYSVDAAFSEAYDALRMGRDTSRLDVGDEVASREEPVCGEERATRAVVKAPRRPMEHVLRPCLGVLCELHRECVRYAAVDETRVPSASFLGYCSDGQGGRPMFLAVEPRAPVPAAV
ncbi:MAG: hypothetical protein JSS56_07880 [Proteobacteria bacterium]|nr:hypothetical protein [Pseudomonadota bacterium]